LRKSPLLPIFLIVAVDVLGLTIMIPLLPFYAEKLGASPSQVGWLVGVYALCQLFSGPLLGRMSDHVGRKPLLIVSQIGTLIGFLVTAFAGALWVVFLGRIIDGATAGNLSLAQAYISDVTKPEERAKSFGIIGIAFGLGFLIGPALSGFLAQYDYSYPAWAAAALSFTSILCTYFLLPQVVPHAGDEASGPGGKRLGLLDWGAYAQYFKRPELASVLTQFFSFCVMFSLFITGFALFAERRFLVGGRPFGPKEVGYLYAYSGFLGLIIQGGLLGRLVKRFGERPLARAGFLSAAVGLTALAFTYPIMLIVPVFTAIAFGTGVLRPTLTSEVTKLVSRREQGVVLGLTQSLNSTSSIVSPLLAGFLIGRGDLKTWALGAAAVSLAGFFLSLRSARPVRA
jgi:MFS transporter, DHA1 family, tetracycline resistance protein